MEKRCATTSQEGEVSVGCYLGARLKSLGVTHFFTVPGDFTLSLLDELLKVEGLDMVTCCNELNAGYAADGYARASGKVGVLVVTYMVGALSAVNAVAGAYSSGLPLLVIVGGPRSHEHRVTHHQIKDFSRSTCRNSFKDVTANTFFIEHFSHAQARIDEAVSCCVMNSKPVYLEVACDATSSMVNGLMPMGALTDLCSFHSDQIALRTAVDEMCSLIGRAKKMVAICGSKLYVTGTVRLFRDLVDKLGCGVAHFPDAKGILNEDSENFMGCYWGSVSMPPIQDVFDEADLVLMVGPVFGDFLSLDWKTRFPHHRIVITPDHVHIEDRRYSFVYMREVLAELFSRVPRKGNPFLSTYKAICAECCPERRYEDLDVALDMQFLANELRTTSHANVGAVVADVGDSWFLAEKLRFAHGSQFFAQLQYSSIGWALAASLGIGTWRQQVGKPGHLLAIMGDGAFQMTAQELSTLIKQNIHATIVLINNGTYALEERIHRGSYNKLNNWNYANFVQAVGGTGGACRGIKVASRKDLRQALKSSFDFPGVCLLECVIDKDDCTPELEKWMEMVAEGRVTASVST